MEGYFNSGSFGGGERAGEDLFELEEVALFVASSLIADEGDELAQSFIDVHCNIGAHQIIGLAYFFFSRFSNSSYSI